MEDTIVKYETAKLAKEKGFTKLFMTTDYIPMYIDGELLEGQGEDDSRENYCLAPSQSILQKRIREKHKLHVNIDIDILSQWEYIIVDTKKLVVLDGKSDFKTYEEALEEGLLEALKNIE